MTADDLRAAQPIFKPALHAQVWSSDSAYNITLMRNESLFCAGVDDFRPCALLANVARHFNSLAALQGY